MKFLCLRCDEPMSIGEVEGSDDNSVGITFVCKKCSNRFAMFTNPMETQLVRGLGVHIGGRSIPAKPMEVIKDTLVTKEDTEDTLVWDSAANARLNNVPPFVRDMARSAIERYAREKGYKDITIEVMDEARKVYGM